MYVWTPRSRCYNLNILVSGWMRERERERKRERETERGFKGMNPTKKAIVQRLI